MYQQKYWNQIKDLRIHSYYVQNYAIKQSRYDQAINIFLAITSSSSIAAWALWKEYQFVWAFIIAASQVVMAIKPLMPYKKRLSALSILGDSLSEISLKAERDWFFVAEGEWTNEEIHKKWGELKEAALTAERTSMLGITLPKDGAALAMAEKDAELYLQSTYFESHD